MHDPIAHLVGLLSGLPGIGERTATRLANFLLGQPPAYAQALGQAVAEIHQNVKRCAVCGNYAAESLCAICADPKRDQTSLCVVAKPPDVVAVERCGGFYGRYYVLHELISPLNGVGPDQLSLQSLVDLVGRESIAEVILATPLSVDGETTALYIAQTLKPLGVHCSRIASGVPHGGELEYTDQITLSRALQGRKEV